MALPEKTKQTLVAVLMEWIAHSRMEKHLQNRDKLIVYQNEIIEFDLSTLSEAYQEKHINENLSKYCNALLVNLSPELKNWCKKNQLSPIEFSFRFRCNTLMFNTKLSISVKMDNAAYRKYLENRST